MNIDMDDSCKNKRTSNRVITSNINKFATSYHGSGEMLIINGKWVTTKYASQIQYAVMVKDHIISPLTSIGISLKTITSTYSGKVLARRAASSLTTKTLPS